MARIPNQFKGVWKRLTNPARNVEIRQEGGQWITSWVEGSANYEEAFRERLQAEEKATQLYGGDITYDGDAPMGKSSAFRKSSDALTRGEIREVQSYIERLQAKGKNASQIIRALQSYNDKLSDYYKAKRAFDTGNKGLQTESVLDSSEELGIDKFRVIINPHACEECRHKTRNGEKIFTERELTKDGYGHRPPFHPNCFCTLIPA